MNKCHTMKSSFAIVLPFLALVSLGAGCLNKQSRATPENSGPAQQASGAPKNSGWQAYENGYYGISFEYPTEKATEEYRSDQAVGKIFAVDLGETVVSSTSVSAPRLSMEVLVLEGTGKGLSSPARMQDGCYSGSEGAEIIKPAMVIGGLSSCLAKARDSAMGNDYRSYWYTILKEDKAMVLAFQVHSLSCGYFENPGACIPFDEHRDAGMVEGIASTFRFVPKESSEQVRFETRNTSASTSAYTIDFDYPVLVGASSEAVDRVEAEIEAFVATTTKLFLESAETNLEYQSELGGNPYVLQAKYSVVKYSEKVSNVIFHGYLYTGGAHGMPIIRTFIFDVSSGQRLTLADLFQSGTDYLGAMSDFSAAEIARRDVSDPDWIKSGTEPKPENYQEYYLTREGLMVIFPPYQVAAYAAGPQEVLIPFDRLKGLRQEFSN